MDSISNIIVTRPAAQSGPLAAQFIALGFKTVVFPTIAIVSTPVTGEDSANLTRFIGGEFAWVVFVSQNSVEGLRDALQPLLSSRSFPLNTKIAVQGKRTAEIVAEVFGREPDLIPSEFTAEALSESLIALGINGSRILIPVGSKARGVISRLLVKAGAQVCEVLVYENVTLPSSGPEVDAILALDPSHTLVTMFSPSAVHGFWARFPGREDFIRKLSFASVGPTTTQALKSYGISPRLEAVPHSEEGMIRAIRGS